MAKGTQASGNYGTRNVSGGSVSQADNLLSQLDAESLQQLASEPLGRGLRRKVEKRLRRMGVPIPLPRKSGAEAIERVQP